MSEPVLGPAADAPPYAPLTFSDANEQDLVARALADATSKLPGWVPREGNTEVVLLEAQALIVAELVFAMNRLGPAVLEGLLGLYGLARDRGAIAYGRVEIVLADSLGHTVPGGLALAAEAPPTGETVLLYTTESLEVLYGQTTGEVGVRAAAVGVAGHNLPAGQVMRVVDAIAFVEQVTVVATPAGGRLPEDDAAYAKRGTALLGRLVETLVLPKHFTAAALTVAGVGRAHTIDLYDPGQAGSPGDHVGHVTVAIADATGGLPSPLTFSTVEAELTGQAVAGLRIHIASPTATTVDMALTVASDGTDTATVAAAVEAELRAWMSPAAWLWTPIVYRTEIIGRVARVAGVARVVALATPAADVALPGVAPLAQAGTVTVTVEAP